jgi:hypothetical protein
MYEPESIFGVNSSVFPSLDRTSYLLCLEHVYSAGQSEYGSSNITWFNFLVENLIPLIVSTPSAGLIFGDTEVM